MPPKPPRLPEDLAAAADALLGRNGTGAPVKVHQLVSSSTGEVYEGELDDEGRRHGRGILRWVNGNCYLGRWVAGAMHGPDGIFVYAAEGDRYTGGFEQDKKSGQGRYVFANGNYYEGQFHNDKRHGTGHYSWTCGDSYEGEWVDGHMQGRGVTLYSNGNRYEGEFVSDRREGTGTLMCADGLSYTGKWQQNMRHGYGVLSFPGGDKYEGEWFFDKKHGRGRDTFANGNVYDGGYVANLKQGEGRMLYAGNGDAYEGEWSKDMMHGTGRYSFGNGFEYNGDWAENCRHGQGSYRFPNGDTYTGQWVRDKRHGPGELRVKVSSAGGRTTSDYYIGQWQQGRLHGHVTVRRVVAEEAPAGGADKPAGDSAPVVVSSGIAFEGEWSHGAAQGGCYYVDPQGDIGTIPVAASHASSLVTPLSGRYVHAANQKQETTILYPSEEALTGLVALNWLRAQLPPLGVDINDDNFDPRAASGVADIAGVDSCPTAKYLPAAAVPALEAVAARAGALLSFVAAGWIVQDAAIAEVNRTIEDCRPKGGNEAADDILADVDGCFDMAFLTRRLQQLNEHLEQLRRDQPIPDTSEATEKLAELKRELDDRQLRLKNLEKLGQTMTKLKARIEAAERQLAPQRTLIASRQQEAEQIRARTQEVQEETAALVAKIEAGEGAAQLEKKAAALEGELTKLKDPQRAAMRAKELTSKLQAVRHERSKLLEQQGELEQREARTRTALAEAEAMINTAKQQGSDAEAQLTEIRAVIDRKQEQYDRLLQESAELDKKVAAVVEATTSAEKEDELALLKGAMKLQRHQAKEDRERLRALEAEEGITYEVPDAPEGDAEEPDTEATGKAETLLPPGAAQDKEGEGEPNQGRAPVAEGTEEPQTAAETSKNNDHEKAGTSNHSGSSSGSNNDDYSDIDLSISSDSFSSLEGAAGEGDSAKDSAARKRRVVRKEQNKAQMRRDRELVDCEGRLSSLLLRIEETKRRRLNRKGNDSRKDSTVSSAVAFSSSSTLLVGRLRRHPRGSISLTGFNEARGTAPACMEPAEQAEEQPQQAADEQRRCELSAQHEREESEVLQELNKRRLKLEQDIDSRRAECNAVETKINEALLLMSEVVSARNRAGAATIAVTDTPRGRPQEGGCQADPTPPAAPRAEKPSPTPTPGAPAPAPTGGGASFSRSLAEGAAREVAYNQAIRTRGQLQRSLQERDRLQQEVQAARQKIEENAGGVAEALLGASERVVQPPPQDTHVDIQSMSIEALLASLRQDGQGDWRIAYLIEELTRKAKMIAQLRIDVAIVRSLEGRLSSLKADSQGPDVGGAAPQ